MAKMVRRTFQVEGMVRVKAMRKYRGQAPPTNLLLP